MTSAQTRTVTSTLQGVQRLKNSPDGNPNFRVFTMHGSYRTEPNAQVNHLITNFIGKLCRLTFNERGNIIGVELG